MKTTQQYFPCRPFYAIDDSGRYFLGEAFLQAAFIGMNWQVEFFLAQAPGPGVGASNITPIGPTDTRISTDPIENFAVTWVRNWTALSDADNSRSTTVLPIGATSRQQTPRGIGNDKNLTTIPTGTNRQQSNPTGATNGQQGTSGSRLASRAKIGIAVGVIVSALAFSAVV